MLAVVPLFFWGRSCFGAPTALLSCVIFALLPVHLAPSTVGRPDNELIEPIWAALLFFAYTAGSRRARAPGSYHRQPSGLRPAVATVYGIETHGMLESAAFFLASDNKEFLGILDENKARYFILSKSIGALSGYAELLGRPSDGYLNERVNASGRTVLETGPEYFNLVHVNLYLADGEALAGPIPFAGVGGVRLVYESQSRSDVGGLDREIKQYKVFERVKGAVIEGEAGPGQRVALAGVVRTNQSRRFYSVTKAVAGPDGSYSVNAWYPLYNGNGVGVEGGYILKTGSGERRVLVTEEDVTEGSVINVR